MIVLKKKNKKALLIGALALALAALIVLAVVLNTLLVADDGEEERTPPEIIAGLEDIYNNSAVAYTHIGETDINFIRVVGDENEYALSREESGTVDSSGKPVPGPFILYYRDSFGQMQVYEPKIAEHDPNFAYEDMYSVVTDDSFGMIPKLTYLCVAIGTTYFDERIDIADLSERFSEDRETILQRYGLSDDKSVKITFKYYDSEKAEKYHTLKIGDPMITGTGYYFMVDDRDYIYSVESNSYFKYALADFTSFINPVLVAEGLSQDKAFEPYLTTGFKQWKNEIYSDEGDIVLSDSKVIVTAKTYVPYISRTENISASDGYIKDSYKAVAFDLDDLRGKSGYSVISSALVGRAVGALSDSITVTVPTYTKIVSFDEGKNVYSYRIEAIEAIIRGGEDLGASETVTATDTVKVIYTATVGGTDISNYKIHGVIDLSNEKTPASVRSALIGKSVGSLAAPVELSVAYNESNSLARNIKIVISEIITVVDAGGKNTAVATVGTTVLYRYNIVVDGERIDGDYTEAITITDSLTGQAKTIADALVGRGQTSGLSIEISDYKQYSEFIGDFIAYEIRSIDYFVTKEEIVSFKYQQASERDPYYGESLYQNMTSGQYSIYPLNAAACEAVVSVLGGIDENATLSLGLSGSETVAIGITPELMQKYHLYDYTVYFELPRGITPKSGGSVSEKLDDYTFYDTLGFTLYISEDMGDGTRYIASDMYDVIAKIDTSKFEFLRHGFADFYARRVLMLTNISNIASMNFEFYMSDFSGNFKNELIHQKIYAYNGALYSAAQLTKEQLAVATQVDGITVNVTPSGSCTDNKLSQFLSEKGYSSVSLFEFYDKKTVEGDTLGTSNFKELTELIFYTNYEGNLTEQEQQAALATAPLLMKMRVTLGKDNSSGEYEIYSAYDYVYEFYRISDRRVMVKLYRENRSTGVRLDEVSDFYLSTFSFKKIVNLYKDILNKEPVDNAKPY